MNILITSAGRRTYIVQYFKEVLAGHGKVYVCNSESCVAFQYASESVISPLIYDNDYITFLLGYCLKKNIQIIVSLFDIDLYILSKSKHIFEEHGIRVIVSSEDVMSICNDKWLTHCFLTSHGFCSPRTYLKLCDALAALSNNVISYPLIVKPRFGCGSIGLNVAYDYEELLYVYNKCGRRINETYLKYESSSVNDRVLIQEKIDGQEYGADIINDLQCNNRSVILRKKIAMRAGETDIADVVSNVALENELSRLGTNLRHIANLDCDFILCNDIPYIIDLNARFGGGYPFSHVGGCNLPKAIIEWSRGSEVPDEILRPHVGYRAFKEIIITIGD